MMDIDIQVYWDHEKWFEWAVFLGNGFIGITFLRIAIDIDWA